MNFHAKNEKLLVHNFPLLVFSCFTKFFLLFFHTCRLSFHDFINIFIISGGSAMNFIISKELPSKLYGLILFLVEYIKYRIFPYFSCIQTSKIIIHKRFNCFMNVINYSLQLVVFISVYLQNVMLCWLFVHAVRVSWGIFYTDVNFFRIIIWCGMRVCLCGFAMKTWWKAVKQTIWRWGENK